MIDRFISWLYTRRIWGQRCIDYDPGCPCCHAWELHDFLFNDKGLTTGVIASMRPGQLRKAVDYDGPISCGEQ